MNDNWLISAGVMNLYWSGRNKDTLDLMMPFLKSAIYKTTKIGEKIVFENVKKVFVDDYGYGDFPSNVMELMLRRLSPKYVRKEDGKYYLKYDFSEQVNEFNKRKKEFRYKKNQVISQIKNHLEKNLIRKKYNDTQIEELLYDFLGENALDMTKSVEQLRRIKHRDDPEKYELAKFILEQNKKQTEIFDYINDMTVGFFISTAVSSSQSLTALTKSINLKGLTCYLDTRIVINALGLKSKEYERSSREFIKMLRDAGVKVMCFRHNVDELNSVLNAYKRSLDSTSIQHTGMTLEMFDEKCFGREDVELYQSTLDNKITSIGIGICEKPGYTEEQYVIDELGLESELSEKIRYNKKTVKKAVECDVASISAIYRLRKGRQSSRLEQEKYIFITNNGSLCRCSTKFLKEKDRCIHSVMTDLNMAGIIWLNNYTRHKDYPKIKMLENAASLVEPSNSFIDRFLEKINKLETSGQLGRDEAMIMSRDIFCRREMMEIVKSEGSKISDDSVFEVRDRLKEVYTKETVSDNNRLLKEVYEKEQARKNNINRKIDEVGEKEYKKISRRLKVASVIISIVLFVCFIISVILLLERKTPILFMASIFLGLIELISLVGLIKGGRSVVAQIIHKYANKKASQMMDKKKDEYEDLL